MKGGPDGYGANEFRQLRRGAYVLNTGCGGLVNETALQAALDEDKIASAWLDAFAEVPYHGPLKNYREVLLTPHVGYTPRRRRDARWRSRPRRICLKPSRTCHEPWFLATFSGSVAREGEFSGDEVEHGGHVFHRPVPASFALHG